jgi:hypothetical protein
MEEGMAELWAGIYGDYEAYSFIYNGQLIDSRDTEFTKEPFTNRDLLGIGKVLGDLMKRHKVTRYAVVNGKVMGSGDEPLIGERLPTSRLEVLTYEIDHKLGILKASSKSTVTPGNEPFLSSMI